MYYHSEKLLVSGKYSQPHKLSSSMHYLLWPAAIIALYLISQRNYLLFHGLIELFSITVGGALFTIAWLSRQYIKNRYLLFLGIAYLFISMLDLLHMLSYTGMPFFPDYNYYTNQMWIGARLLESLSLLLAFFFLNEKRKIRVWHITFAYLAVSTFLVLSIFHWKNFPICFIEGQGLTPFKKISEYAICLLLAASIVLLVRFRPCFDKDIFRLMLLSLLFTILSELAFTFYISNFSFSNLVGHYFKLFSFWCIYLALIQNGIAKPYDLIFRDLEKKNRELQEALAQVKTLSGLLPICASCKNVRDDQGYWHQIEGYLRSHADVGFSHGICPDCMEKLYPEFYPPFQEESAKQENFVLDLADSYDADQEFERSEWRTKWNAPKQ